MSEILPYLIPLGPDGELRGNLVTLINELDFSKFISETYGRPYRFQQQGDMMGQDTIWLFEVPSRDGGFGDWSSGPRLEEWSTRDATPPQDTMDRFRWELWWERDYYPGFEALVADLHRRGLIRPGKYALHVWW